jgi:beta-N-acetylhexosaminidase
LALWFAGMTPSTSTSWDLRTVISVDQYNGETAGTELWRATLGSTWPLRERGFFAATSSRFASKGAHTPNVSVSATREGKLIGYAAARVLGKRATLIIILVHPSRQGLGVGTRLLKTLDSALRERGVREITLGAGVGSYFWPGVPHDLARANKFFDSRGFTRTEASADLLGDIRGFTAPARVIARAERADVEFALATASDANAVLALQNRCFPQWQQHYRRVLARPQDVLVAHANGRVIAACLLDDDDENFLFPALIPGAYGAISCVGVDVTARSHGVGLALVAEAAEILAARGVEQCFIGYTHLSGWYQQLGFRIWHSYRMGARTLTEATSDSYNPFV